MEGGSAERVRAFLKPPLETWPVHGQSCTGRPTDKLHSGPAETAGVTSSGTGQPHIQRHWVHAGEAHEPLRISNMPRGEQWLLRSRACLRACVGHNPRHAGSIFPTLHAPSPLLSTWPFAVVGWLTDDRTVEAQTATQRLESTDTHNIFIPQERANAQLGGYACFFWIYCWTSRNITLNSEF